MVLAELTGAFIITLSILYIYFKFVIFNFWRKMGAFYVEPIVPFGNVMALVTGKISLGVFFQDIYMKYKNHRVIGIYVFFKPQLIIADLDLIRIVLTKKFENFHDRGTYCNEKIDPLFTHLVSLPGKKWQNLRVKLTPTFTLTKLKQIFPLVKDCGEELVKYLNSKAEIGDSINMNIIQRYAIDVIMSTAFGIKSNCIEEPNNEYHIQSKKIFFMNPIYLVMAMFWPQIMEFFSIPITDRQVTIFYTKVFQENVKYRQVHKIVRHDFMNLLIQLMERGYIEPDDKKKATNKPLTINKLTMAEAIAQSYLFFLAGFDSSSTVITFALYELAQHQNLQVKVRKEIDEMLTKHDGLSYDALNEMTYLHKVINETMRKYPPLPLLNRKCTEEIVLPTTNIRVPKGTSITVPVLGLHRDPSLYPDPDKFDPERFNADKIAQRHPYAFLPFGEGPRNCIGARFGYITVKIALVSLLSKYKFKPSPRTAVPLIFRPKTLGLSVTGGVHLIIESR